MKPSALKEGSLIPKRTRRVNGIISADAEVRRRILSTGEEPRREIDGSVCAVSILGGEFHLLKGRYSSAPAVIITRIAASR
jgi:hypothetical protein